MKLLLDTHILLWSFFDEDMLSDHFVELLESPEHDVYCSSVSLWEIALKFSKHPDSFPFDPELIRDCCDDAAIAMLPLRHRHVVALSSLQLREGAAPHNDPFDKMLLAQAKAEGAHFLTHDKRFRDYLEPCVLFE